MKVIYLKMLMNNLLTQFLAFIYISFSHSREIKVIKNQRKIENCYICNLKM